MSMIPIISNKSFERIGMIDDYISFIWTSRFYTSGDFELVINTTHTDMIQIGYHVERDDDENIGIIETIKIEKQEDGNDVAIISGRFLISILGRRIIAAQSSFTNKTIGYIVESLLWDNVISPQISARAIANIETMTDMELFGPTINIQMTGTNLLTAISDMCSPQHIGQKMTRDAESGMLQLFLYYGTDRSADQSVNPRVIFSEKYDNLISSDFEESHKNIINAVLVAGEGEGIDRKTTWVTDALSPTGMNRYEFYKDARNVQSNGGQIDPDEYKDMLKGVGKEVLTQFTQAFGAQVDFTSVRYKEDVFLGDLVTITNERWGISTNARLAEVIESTDEAGLYTINPTFTME